MSQERAEKKHYHPERREPVSRDERYMTDKLRSAAVTFGPSVVLDLFQSASVLLTALGRLPDPQRSGVARVLRPIISAGALAPWAYLLLVRPWHTRWGATDEEVRKGLPGDDLVPHPMLESTRAITISAPAARVWPWLVQLGQDRGGFYSYDWLENLAAADIHNVDRIVPEMQHLKVGDFIPLAPIEWGIPTGGFTVAMVEPGRAMVWRQGRPQDLGAPGADGDGETWSFVLAEPAEGTTRLILRERKGLKPRMKDVLLYYLFVERQHFVMVRRMLLGLRERAERAQSEQMAARS
jgi:hypothetical protein